MRERRNTLDAQPMEPDYLPVLDFWFRELTPHQWFAGGGELDQLIRERFGTLLEQAKEGAHDAWARTPRGRLALIVVLDQFSRNVFRGTPNAYAGDAKAQQLAREGIAAGMDKPLTLDERQSFYMPLQHAEDVELQALSVAKFGELKDEAAGAFEFARGHRSAVERFGRFPHRNAVLGRASTPDGEQFLASKANEMAGGEPR